MTIFRPTRLLCAAIAAAAALPAAALAQPANPPRSAPDPAAELTAPDREVLAIAEQLAADTGQRIEQWIASQSISEDRMFARFYYPIAKTDPQKYTTDYDKLADRDLVALEDRALDRAATFQYAIVTDVNGYAPAFNHRFAQPLTGDLARDYVNSRSKRLLGDPGALAAGRSETHYLLQRTRNDQGDVIYDLSVPIVVRGKHWGCARIGYRRAE